MVDIADADGRAAVWPEIGVDDPIGCSDFVRCKLSHCPISLVTVSCFDWRGPRGWGMQCDDAIF
jgi:hypothetical protein